ncbi:LSU ribosomal protein L15p (L27Ae), mitochondrial [Paraburkholderia tropica]|uniref:hypothetical protein n=1 Tax=Paraburkholderia tropica TaxID=92647 RepID=UPI001CB57511|nr:hypothetical protein [Paraburkholderia tropica]CAG9227891.1 LSU ribosomal protein L15p (L27Ae), mitochondrial [Paraburkholderia tropica]
MGIIECIFKRRSEATARKIGGGKRKASGDEGKRRGSAMNRPRIGYEPGTNLPRIGKNQPWRKKRPIQGKRGA